MNGEGVVTETSLIRRQVFDTWAGIAGVPYGGENHDSVY